MMLRKLMIWPLFASMLFCACAQTAPEPTAASTSTERIAETTVETVPVTAPPAPTAPPHSDFYIPGVSADDVVVYFHEVCLNAEYINSGDPSFLQRWEAPITYAIYGDCTPEDAAKVSEFCQWLNTIEGFPGIHKAGENDYVNLRIHFCDQQTLLDLMGEQYRDMDGAVTFWYEEDIIFDAIICIRTDLDQNLRNCVILEEIYNGLGPIQDTSLRPDSIIYSEFSQPQALTEMDELILRLLYHPSLSCGMDAAQCEAAIRALYY